MPAAADYCACGCVSLRSSSKTERQKFMSSKTLRERSVAKRESYLTTPDWSGVLARLQVLSFCLGRIASRGRSWVSSTPKTNKKYEGCYALWRAIYADFRPYMGRYGLPHHHPIYGVVPFFDGLCLYLPEVRAGFGAVHRVASDRHDVMLLVLLCLWLLWNCEL